MTDTNTSGADFFALDRQCAEMVGGEVWCLFDTEKKRHVRTSVAALIAREAIQAGRIADLSVENSMQAKRIAALESERDALTAEVKALRNRVAILEDAGAIAADILEGSGAHCFALSDALASASAATGGGNG